MKIGDKVSVLDDAIDGVITTIVGDVVTISTEDDFEMQFPKNEIIVIDDLFSENSLQDIEISQIISEKEESKPKRVVRTRKKERNLPPMEVDLHIHQLTKNYKRMSNYDMLTLQLDTAKRQLEFAISKRITKVVFIHGVGQGVLKSELEFLFNRYEGLKFYEADYQKYGQGAMEVYFLQNKNN